MTRRHKSFCKEFGLKYEDSINARVFQASKLIPVRAGMKMNLPAGKITDPKIKTIGKRRTHFVFYCHDFNHDIQLVNEYKEPKIN